MRALLAPALLALLACSPAAPAPPAAPPPVGSAPPPAAAGPDEGLCSSLCGLAPSAAAPAAPAIKSPSLPEGKARLLLLWKEPNGDSIQALGALDDLAERIKGANVELLVVSIDDDGARVSQARRELIDKNTPVRLIFGVDAQALAASLAPERLPVAYVLDSGGHTVARFDGASSWRSPSVRPFFDAVLAGQHCSLVFDKGKPDRPCPAP